MKKKISLVIDFETANVAPTSACSIGVVVLEGTEIVHRMVHLIRPPTEHFIFTHIHGLTWKQVSKEPTFGEIWKLHLEPWFQKASKIIAHNVGFDDRVLRATAAHYGIDIPKIRAECTVKLARRKLGIYPSNLKHVCNTLGIELNHHEALSDAMASAYIYLHAKTGEKPWLQGELELVKDAVV